MSDFLKRSFTRREKFLLLMLLAVLLVGFYFLAVHFPIVNRMEAIERDAESLDTQIAAAETRAAEYAAMKQELDEILSQPKEDITVMPPYSNLETLMRKLNDIFAGTNANFDFNQVQTTDDIAARTINFSCTAENYQAARRLLRDVTGTGYRSLLDSFTLTPAGGNLYTDELQVSGAITFYEHIQSDDPAAEEPAEPAEEE